MTSIHPIISFRVACLKCNSDLEHGTIHWQGVHTCSESICKNCGNKYLVDFPINQSTVLYRILEISTNKIFDKDGNDVTKETRWFNDKLLSVMSPKNTLIKVDIEKKHNFKNVMILNTVDYCYGHSLLLLFNLQRLIHNLKNSGKGIVVIIQPMMKWLIPKEGIAEIWTVNLTFNNVNNYYPAVSKIINEQITRFESCYISRGHLLPTKENIVIENFTGIVPYCFDTKIKNPRITFIWREDPGRLWIKNIYLLKGLQKLGFGKILLPIHYLRIRLFLYLLHKKIRKTNYQLTIAGLGNYGRFQNYVDDKRVNGFSIKEEINTCQIYAESELVIGVHGSSMLLPSAHAGMAISMMPSKRWGNFAEDILYRESDVRQASFQRRVIPINLSLLDTIDICMDMLLGRDYFIKKFMHNEEP